MADRMEQINEKANRYEEMTLKYGDPWIWGIYFMLILFSVVETYSASSREVVTMGVYMPILRHCFYLIMGGLIIFYFHKIPYNNPIFLGCITVGLLAFTCASLVYVQFFGDIINGARRSFRLFGFFSIQPSEFAKLSVVTALSLIFSRTQQENGVSRAGILWSSAVIVFYGVFTFQNGLTNFALLGGITFVMMLVGGISIKRLITTIVVLGMVGGGFWYIKNINDSKTETIIAAQNEQRVLDEGEATDEMQAEIALKDQEKPKDVDRSGLRRSRFNDWWNSDSLLYKPITDKNSQEMFSRMAQAHGGVTGVFFGNSRETSRLPLAFSDYIFSIIVEDTGLIGGIFVLLLFLGLMARAFMIARRCRRTLPALIVTGTAAMITLQALVHMAINVGVVPVSGQPLPLISKGGSSIMIVSFAFAILLSISRTVAGLMNKQNATKEDQNLPEELRAENPSLTINYTNVWK